MLPKEEVLSIHGFSCYKEHYVHNCNEHFLLSFSGVERGEQSLSLPAVSGLQSCQQTGQVALFGLNPASNFPSWVFLLLFFFLVGCFLGEFFGCGFRFQLVALAVWCKDLLQECRGCWLQVVESSALGWRVHLEEPFLGPAFSVLMFLFSLLN